MEPTALSVTCYVSAQGLKTDLTTLQLVASESKAERTAELIRAISFDILRPREFAFEALRSEAKRDDRVAALGLGVFGVAMLPALPLGLLLLWAGHRALAQAGEKVGDMVKQVIDNYPLLQEGWRTAHASYLPPSEDIPGC